MILENIGQPELSTEIQSIQDMLNFEVYLVGGTIRNALYYEFFQEHLIQRDFDIACPKEKMDEFKGILSSLGYVPGNIDRTDQYTMKKARVRNPQNSADYIVFDISTGNEFFWTTMDKADFTIGGLVLPFSKILDPNWEYFLVGLPETKKDIQRKILKLHQAGSRSLFRTIRFMAYGFSRPSEHDLIKILEAHKTLSLDTLEANRKKLKKLVSQPEIEKICWELGIEKSLVS